MKNYFIQFLNQVFIKNEKKFSLHFLLLKEVNKYLHYRVKMLFRDFLLLFLWEREVEERVLIKKKKVLTKFINLFILI